ncbi:MAG TPA: MFS transporter [Longimicrobium sp.]|nr:MFS transporter [Longimicrobium sp.]
MKTSRSLSTSASSAASRAFRSAADRPRLARTEPTARGRSPLAVVFVTVFLDLVGFGIVIPLLPLYAERFGAGPVAAAWLLAIYSLMQFLFAPWWGRLSDRIGRRPVLLVGIAGAALSYLGFGLAGSLVWLFVARAVNGVMGANVGVAQAYIADVTPPEERARGMGLIGAAFGLGFIFGPALGGFLSRWGAHAPFLGAAALAAANFVLAWYRLPESLPPEVRGAANARNAGLRARLSTVLAAPGTLRGLYATVFAVTMGIAGAEATMALWAGRRWGLGFEAVGYGFAIVGVVAAIAQGMLVGPLVRRVGERRAGMLGLALIAAGMVLVPLAPSLWMVVAAGAVFALGQASATPAVYAMISHQGGAADQGRILAATQSVNALARVLGPWMAGMAFAAIGIAAPYAAAAMLAGVALVVLVTAAREQAVAR